MKEDKEASENKDSGSQEGDDAPIDVSEEPASKKRKLNDQDQGADEKGEADGDGEEE
ncbi:hypothetical protein JL09_g6786, partial [Pichia kudriavzevii]